MGKMIGAEFMLSVPCLGNPAGTHGYVFNEYPDFDNPRKLGLQVIFQNGQYDGFSIEEQSEFMELIGIRPEYTGYNFRNVMQVTTDFRRGYWKWK